MYEYQGVALIPIVMMLAQFLKAQGLNNKLIPVVSLIISLICGILLNLNDVFKGILVGLQIAFTAMGLYSGAKTTIELFRET